MILKITDLLTKERPNKKSGEFFILGIPSLDHHHPSLSIVNSHKMYNGNQEMFLNFCFESLDIHFGIHLYFMWITQFLQRFAYKLDRYPTFCYRSLNTSWDFQLELLLCWRYGGRFICKWEKWYLIPDPLSSSQSTSVQYCRKILQIP